MEQVAQFKYVGYPTSEVWILWFYAKNYRSCKWNQKFLIL